MEMLLINLHLTIKVSRVVTWPIWHHDLLLLDLILIVIHCITLNQMCSYVTLRMTLPQVSTDLFMQLPLCPWTWSDS